jgi:hypothetical protein
MYEQLYMYYNEISASIYNPQYIVPSQIDRFIQDYLPTPISKSKLPKNNYSQQFIETRLRPQNYVKDSDFTARFEEYPKLRELIEKKDDIVNKYASHPMYMK